MVKVEIRCPSCSKMGHIEIGENIIKKISRGVTAVDIEKDQLCSHSFVAYVDKNLIVRDCFLTDFIIELPQIETKQKDQEKECPGFDLIDVDTIKLNIFAFTLTSIVRACLLKQRVLILNDLEFINDNLVNFFSYIFQNSFEIDVNIKNHEYYQKNKKHSKEFIIFDGKNIINDKDKLMIPKRIKIESKIIQKFLEESNPKLSLIVLKNEIHKSFELVNEIMNYIKIYDGKEKLAKKVLIDKLVEKYLVKISFEYLEFLLDIIKYYYNFDLSALSDYYFPALGI